jgi:protein SCO1/2
MSKVEQKWVAGALAGFLAATVLLAQPASVLAQVANELPRELTGAEIVDKPNAALPLDTVFTDENGNKVKLGDYFNDGKPVLLTMVYLRCPMLCTLVVNGMVDALRDVKYSPGQDFTMLTVSFDPLETPALANIKRRNYLDLYNRSGAATGWHFLTGTEGNIRDLADAIGFGYKWSPEQQSYLHQAGLFVVTPDGHMSRTLYGVDFNPATVKGSLLEAGRGEIGTPLDKVYFSCMHFDAAQGKYTFEVMNLTRAVALLITALTALTLFGFFRHEALQRRRAVAAGIGALEVEDTEPAAQQQDGELSPGKGSE